MLTKEDLLTILNSPAKDKPRVTGAFDQMSSSDSRFEFRRTDWRRSKTGRRRAHQEAAAFLQNLGPARVVVRRDLGPLTSRVEMGVSEEEEGTKRTASAVWWLALSSFGSGLESEKKV